MSKNTCAACDYTLDEKRISVTIGGKTVEVCCEECAAAVRKAHAAAVGKPGGLPVHRDAPGVQ